MANTATSLWFDGTNDYVEFPGNTVDISNTDFTIEWWQWLVANETNAGLFTTHGTSSSTGFHIAQSPAPSNYKIVAEQGGGSWDTANDLNIGIPTVGTWQHWAVVKTGDKKVYSFINGELTASVTLAKDWTTASSGARLGMWSVTSAYINIYLDQFRVSRVARYGHIDIPTTRPKTWQVAGRGQNALLPHHTKVLITAEDVADSGVNIIDRSPYGNPITVDSVTGSTTAAILAAAPHTPTSVLYQDGTDSSALRMTGGTLADLGGDWSAEGWFYPTAAAGEETLMSGKDYAWGIRGSSRNGTDYLGLTIGPGSSPWSSPDPYLALSEPLLTDRWTHIAVGYSGNGYFIYMNGKLGASKIVANQYTASSTDGTQQFNVGMWDTVTTWQYTGYYDNIRYCQGQSAYTPNFTPYGAQKNVAIGRGGAITDARHPSANTHAIRLGQASTATNANTYCLDFDGTADYLLRKTPAWNSADDRGTIVAWIYNDDVSGDENIFGSASSAGTHTYLQLLMGGNKLEVHQVSNDTTADISGGTTLSADTWYMVALTSTGSGTGTYALYVNGEAESLTVNSGTNNGDWLNVTSALARTNIAIGSRVDSSADTFFNGKIMQVAYFGGSSSTTGVLTEAQLLALYNADKGHDFTTATGVYTATETAALKGYWRMGNHYLDSAGDITIYDASGYGADMHGVSMGGATGGCLTWTTGTTFLEGWQDRGYFTGDKYTSLLIQSAHANGSTTFTDSGPGFKKTLFDGAADYASATVTDWQPSDTQGTIIAWVKNDTIAGDDTVFASSDTAGATTFIKFQTAAGKISIEQKNNDTVDEIQGSTAVTAGLWNCLAWQSTGTGYKLYVNGVAETTVVQTGLDSGDWFADTSTADRNNISIGALITNAVGDYFDGQIAQVAVWGGASGTTGILTAAEILAIHDLGPGADLTTSYATGMVGYWTFGNKTDEGDDYVTHATTIYDQSTGSNDDLTGVSLAAPVAGHTASAGGAAYHSGDVSIYGGSAIKFDGTTDYVEIANHVDLQLGGGAGKPYCIEGWFLWYTQPSLNALFSKGGAGNGDVEGYNLYVQGADINWRYKASGGTGGAVIINAPHNINVGTWAHIAVQRDAVSTSTLWIDGILKGSDTASFAGVLDATGSPFRLGANHSTGPGGTWGDYAGYTDEFRITKGITRYTPSIERYANTFVAKGDTGDAYTALQIQSNGAKSGTGYTDSLNRTGYNTGAAVIGGNPTWQTTVGDPLGGANTALSFNGVDDYISFADSADWFPTGAFTYEAWLNYSGTADYPIIFEQATTHNNRMRCTYVSGTDRFELDWYNGTASVDGRVTWEFRGKFTKNEWHHVVMQRHGAAQVGNNWEAFCDGVSLEFQSGSNMDDAFHDIAAPMCFGGRSWSGTNDGYHDFWKGYMDNIRWSKGIARYGGISLRTAQQVVTSSNSDTQVVTSNSTFGTGEVTIPFVSDSYTAILFNGDEVYGAGTTFPAVKSTSLGANTSTVLTIIKGDASSALTYPTQSQGVSAFGANSYFWDAHGSDYLSVAASADWNLAGTKSWTLEFWMLGNATNTSWMRVLQHAQQSGAGWCVRFYGTDRYLGFGRSDISVPQLQNSSATMKDNTWYHVAFQNDYSDSKSKASYFLNGEKVASGNLANTYTSGLSPAQNYAEADDQILYIGQRGGSNDYYYYGYIDSLRISQGIARYEYTGTNTKSGLNAVHPSHAKLLITSNTYNGNTHFDDFSEQGNYWNQTPYSYTFDGTDDKITLTDTGLNLTSSSSRSGAVWVRYNNESRTAKQGLFQIGQTQTATHRAFGTYAQSASDGVRTHHRFYGHQSGSPSTDFFHPAVADETAPDSGIRQPPIQHHEWYLVGYTDTGTAQVLYVNGISVATRATTITVNSDDGGVGFTAWGEYLDGNIAQFSLWNSLLTEANMQSLWELGPAGDMSTIGSTQIQYLAMGNHNDKGGRPADTAATVYDRSGNNCDGVTAGTMYTPHKGKLLIPAGTVKHSTDNKNFGSSAIFFDGNSDYLLCPDDTSLEFGTADFTVETWLYSTHPDSYWAGNAANIIGNSSDAGWHIRLADGTAAGDIKFNMYNYTTTEEYDTQLDYNVLFNNWAHIALQRSGRNITLMVNGIIISNNICTAATVWSPASGQTLSIGARNGGSWTQFWKGYMDEIGIYNGVAKYTAVALPGKATITPSYLPDPSGNHFTTSGLAITDQMLDTPENNFCTFNPLGNSDTSNAQTYSEGNLKLGGKNGNYHMGAGTTIGMSSGKWYAEFKCAIGGGDGDVGIAYSGRVSQNARLYNGVGCISVEGFNDLNASVTAVASATKVLEATAVVNETWATGDIIGIAVDIDNKTVFWTLNNDPIFFYGSGTPTRSGPRLSQYSATNIMGDHPTWMFAIGTYSDTSLFHANFGQGDPDGENNFTDTNGIGGFRFEPPSGFLALCTANMKDADYAPIGPNSAAGAPDQHFDTVLWGGNNTQQQVSMNFQPDLVWLKGRQAISHYLFDSLRGATAGSSKAIFPDAATAEANYTDGGHVREMNKSGFVIAGESSGSNETGEEYVAWCWKAGNGSVEDNSGDITVTRSTNVDAGFSIVRHTGTGTAGKLPHGLGKTPELIINKQLSGTGAWHVKHPGLTAENYLIQMNLAQDEEADNSMFGTTTTAVPDANFFHIATHANINTSGQDYIKYVWTGIEGFSKFGSYYGNNDTDGAFVYLGFKPALLIIKGIDNDSRQWTMYSNKIMPYNGTDGPINFADASTVEDSSGNHHLDFLSNGFKVRNVHDHEGNAETYIYMAWAEMPFKYATGR